MKFSWCSQWRHTGRVDGWLYLFIISAFDWGQWSILDRAVYLRIRNYWYPMDRAWMGPRGTLGILKKRKMDCLCRISKSGSSKPEPRGYNKTLCLTHIMMTMRTIEVKPLAWDSMRACIKITYCIIIICHILIKTQVFNVKSVTSKNFHTGKL